MLAISSRQVLRAVLVEPKLAECSSRDQLMSRLNEMGSQCELAMRTLLDFKRSDFGVAVPPDSKARGGPLTVVQRSNWRPDDPEFKARIFEKRSKPTQVLPASHDCRGLCDKVAAFAFDEELNALRLNNTTDLVHGKKERKSGSPNDERFRCDLCCEHCEKGRIHDIRLGFKTTWICKLCGLHLCNKPRKIWGWITCEGLVHTCAELPQSHPFPFPIEGTSATNSAGLSAEAAVRATNMKTPEDHKVRRTSKRVEEEEEVHMGESELLPRVVDFKSSTTLKRAKDQVVNEAKKAKHSVAKKAKQSKKLSAKN